MRVSSIFLLLVFTLGSGCSDDIQDPNKGVPDAGVDTTASKDGSTPPTPDTTLDRAPDTVPADMGPPIENAFGFTMRIPQEHSVPCESEFPYIPDELVQKDMDWICTFVHGVQQGYVYIQSTVVDCETMMSATGVFEVQGAYFSSQGVVTPLQNAGYNWGGNHHNDWLFFDHDGKSYRYYHSSFGFGWRTCQTMDCLQVYPLGGTTPTEDGCTSDRTLPVVCLEVEAGKSYTEADFVDNFAKCKGDDSR